MSEEKTERKRKIEKWPTYLGHLGPTYLSRSLGLLPLVVSRRVDMHLAGAHADAGEHLAACLAPPSPPKRATEKPGDAHVHFPLSTNSLPVSLARFRCRPRTRRNSPPWKARPTCARDQKSLSIS